MAEATGWYLYGYIDGEDLPRRIPILSTPFRVGRADDLEGTLPVHHVSELHAEFFEQNGELWLRDHNSSNGTFLNREPLVEPVSLRDGDVVHFSTNEFVLRRDEKQPRALAKTMLLSSDDFQLPERFSGGTEELQELIDNSQVIPHYQPVARLSDAQQIIGFEAHGRGGHNDLPFMPADLFAIAESAGLAAPLSAVIRRKGLFLAQVLSGSPKMFVKAHRTEIGDPALVESLRAMRDAIPDSQIVLETNEAAFQSANAMRELQAALADLDIELAYDDFGADQARLVELFEVPPSVIKFDGSLIRDIDQAPVPRQKVLETLVAMVNDLGIDSMAKGIETAEELRICRELGFGFGEGNFIGHPAPIHCWLRPVNDSETETAAVALG